MSHGRALQMFGKPKDPGEDPPKHSAADSGQFDDELPVLMSNASLLSEGLKTEREYRDKHCSLTKSILKEGADPWKSIFAEKRFAHYLPMMAEQYVELVRVKEIAMSKKDVTIKKDATPKEDEASNEDEASKGDETSKEGEKSKEGETPNEDETSKEDDGPSEEDTPLVHGYTGWPAVEGLDLEGFMNWVKRCIEIDHDFYSTVPAWQKAINARTSRLER